ncbi:hypothetical protein CDL15_Pgr016949 [Punica granatum]|uniref:Uncharacterized protein n=1 Tax=Punica granatum TaxID=22663 RepID=A0A218WZ92_PUNGR|nr:hypothetical protein CDL15_Pgr016949 [Punica granatum]
MLKLGKRVTKTVLALRVSLYHPYATVLVLQKSGIQQGHVSHDRQSLHAMITEGKSDCTEVKMHVPLRDSLAWKLRRYLESHELFSFRGLNRMLVKPRRLDIFLDPMRRLMDELSNRSDGRKGGLFRESGVWVYEEEISGGDLVVLTETAYPIAFSGPIQHPWHPRIFYKSGRFVDYGTLASYNASTCSSTPPMKSEHSPPLQHAWLSSTHETLYSHGGPRQSRSCELHLQLPRKPKAPPKRPCAQSYSPSERSGTDFAASSSTPAQKSQTTGNFKES